MRNLPPLVASIEEGSVTWQRLEALNYEMLGYFLSCHLIIEHYLEEHLKVCHSDLDWGSSRLTFAQKISLFSKFGLPDKFNCIPAIKHLNAIRNKLSHDIEFKISEADLIPLSQYLSGIYGDRKEELPKDPISVLEIFTTICCSTFAGGISRVAQRLRITRT